MSAPVQEILVVDDDELWLILLARALGRAHLRVSTFQSAERALEVFTRAPRRFCAVMVDQGMPEMTGIELLGRMRELNPELRTIVHTANPRDPAVRAAFVDLVIPKETEQAALLASLFKLLESGGPSTGPG